MCLIIWNVTVCCCVLLCSLVAVCLLSPKLLMMKAVLYEMSVYCNQTVQCDIPEDNICLWEHQISHSNGTVQSVQFHPLISLYFHVGYKWIVYRNYQTVMAQNFVWQTRLKMENSNCCFFPVGLQPESGLDHLHCSPLGDIQPA